MNTCFHQKKNTMKLYITCKKRLINNNTTCVIECHHDVILSNLSRSQSVSKITRVTALEAGAVPKRTAPSTINCYY